MVLQELNLVTGGFSAQEYWSQYEWKKWVIEITAGPPKRPTFRHTMYTRARDSAGAIECAKKNYFGKFPGGARFFARLATPRDLGCVPAPKRAGV